MPSSLIFASLVVLWLLILVPAVARRRQEVARPSVAALSGRVLERPVRRQGPTAGREREVVDGMNDVDRTDRGTGARDDAPDRDDREVDDHTWERPRPRYRPGRGGFDPEAAARAARARYAFRQRVVLAMLVTALVTGVVAGVALPVLWWAHAAVDLALVCYLVYLRRQVRLEEAIRARRAARMAGTRRMPAAEDPELDAWARRGREATRRDDDHRFDEHDERDDEYDGQPDDEHDSEQDLGAEEPDDDRYRDPDDDVDEPDRDRDDEKRSPASADAAEDEPALPRLRPAPPPALPAGTSLVEVDEDDPELHDLDIPVHTDYRRAAGE